MDIARLTARGPLFRKLSMSAFLILDCISLVVTPDAVRPLIRWVDARHLDASGPVLSAANGCRQVHDCCSLISRRDRTPADGSVHRIGSIGMLAQLAGDRLNGRASARRRRRSCPVAPPPKRGEGPLTMPLKPTGRWRRDCTPRWSKTGLPAHGARSPDRVAERRRTNAAWRSARLLIEAPGRRCAGRADQQSRTPTDGRPWRSCSNAGAAASVVASHDRALLARVDRIVERHAGRRRACSAARGRPSRKRAMPRAPAPKPSSTRASDALAQHRARAFRKPARRKRAATRPAAPGAPPAVEDKMLHGLPRKQRAENSGARESRIADRLIGDRADALEQARARVEILTPLSIESAQDEFARQPRARRLQRCGDGLRQNRHLFGPLSFEVRGPERDRDPRRQRLRQDHAVPSDHWAT